MNNRLILSKVYTLDISTQEHCEMCRDITRNYIDCPICLTQGTPTNAYFDLDFFEEESFVLECKECKSQFKLVGDSWYGDSRVIKLKQQT